MNGVLNSKRDPRAEKLRDYRNAGHCHGGGRRHPCGICHPHKRWKALRQAVRRERKRIGLTPLSPRA